MNVATQPCDLPHLEDPIVEVRLQTSGGTDSAFDVVRHFRRCVAEAVATCNIPSDVAFGVSVSAHELMANAMLHGNAPFRAALDVGLAEARVTVHDAGRAFQWPPLPHPVPPPESHGLALIRLAGGHLGLMLSQPCGKSITATFAF